MISLPAKSVTRRSKSVSVTPRGSLISVTKGLPGARSRAVAKSFLPLVARDIVAPGKLLVTDTPN
jgi:hypothetical protein